MVAKYFNISVGKPDATGTAVIVDTSKSVTRRLGDASSFSGGYNFRHFRTDKQGEHYHVDKEAYSVGNAFHFGQEDIFDLCVEGDGNLSLDDKRVDGEVFIEETTREEAGKLEEGARNWAAMQL